MIMQVYDSVTIYFGGQKFTTPFLYKSVLLLEEFACLDCRL